MNTDHIHTGSEMRVMNEWSRARAVVVTKYGRQLCRSSYLSPRETKDRRMIRERIRVREMVRNEMGIGHPWRGEEMSMNKGTDG